MSGCRWCLQRSDVRRPQAGGSLDALRGPSCSAVLESVLRHPTTWSPLRGRCAVWVSWETYIALLTSRFCYVNNVVVGAMHGGWEGHVPS